MSWLASPQNPYIELPSVLQNMTVFGDSVFTELIKLK